MNNLLQRIMTALRDKSINGAVGGVALALRQGTAGCQPLPARQTESVAKVTAAHCAFVVMTRQGVHVFLNVSDAPFDTKYSPRLVYPNEKAK
jgi:hypothetical protein